MKLDVIDIFKDAYQSLIGRIIIVVLVVNIFGALGIIVGSEDDFELLESLLFALPLLFMTILGGIGLVTLPLLFAFTFVFARFDVHLGFLAIPAALAFFSTFEPYL